MKAAYMEGRRKFARHTLVRFVWYKSLESSDAAAEGVGYLIDVSQGGLGLVAQQSIAPDRLVFVKVVFEGLKHNLAAVGRVVFCKQGPEGYQLGLEFIALPPDSREFIMVNFG